MSSAACTRDDRAVLDKAFSLLAVLHEADRPLGVSELARRSGLSKSTAFRVLSTLERNGGVAKDGTTYSVGSRLRGLSTPATSTLDTRLREILSPFLVDAHVATGATVQLSVLEGRRIRFINKVHGHRSTLTCAGAGTTASAIHSASGRLLLAHDADLLDAVLADRIRPRTPRTVTDAEDLRRQIQRTIPQGFCQESEQSLVGVSCVAVPVRGRGPAPVAAISVVASDPALLGRHLPVLRRVAAAASKVIAATPQVIGDAHRPARAS